MLTPSRHERPRERERRHFQRFPLYMQLVGPPPPRSQHPQHPVIIIIIIIIIITASLQSTSDSEIFSSWFLCCSLQRHWRHQGVEGVTLHFTVFHIRTQRTRLWLIRHVIVSLRRRLIRTINWMDDNVSQKWFLLNEIVKLAELRSLNLMNFNLFHKIVLFKKRTQFYIL